MVMAVENRVQSPVGITVYLGARQGQALFSVAMQTEIGGGASTLFQSEHWLQGQRIADLSPRLLAAVPKRRINSRNVQEGLAAGKWIADVQGALTLGVITKFLQLWDMLLSVELQQGVNENHFCRLATDKKILYEGGL
jgi:hypothetical protein